ncbi:MAG: addiction module protein [Akkermansiaceae bacterium]|nr:addiction module protein [Luteolibacter sp.]
MSNLAEIRESVVSLSKLERAELAVFLLGSLDDAHYWVEDEELENRSAELDSGSVVGVTKEEFKKLCGR